MHRCLILAAAALVAAAPPPATAPTALVTATSLEALQRCFTTRWGESGRMTAINTAAGVLLDFSFEAVGADGRVAGSHVRFAIDDRGTERRVTATAAPADRTLAAQMLRDAVTGCGPGAPAGGSPGPLLQPN